MPGPTTQVWSEDYKNLMGAYTTFRSDFAAFCAQVDVHLAYIKWVGVFFSSLLLSIFIGSLGVAWNASAMNSNLEHQNFEIKQLTTEIKELSSRVEKTERNVETMLQQLVQQGTRIEKTEKNIDIIMQQLGRIEKRLEPMPGRPIADIPLPQ